MKLEWMTVVQWLVRLWAGFILCSFFAKYVLEADSLFHHLIPQNCFITCCVYKEGE